MPAPLAVDKEAVRVLVVAVGSAEAARRTGLPEGTVRQWSKRGGWTAGVKECAALAAGSPTPERVALAASLPESMRPLAVTGVTNPADALLRVIADRLASSRLSRSRYVQRASARLAVLPSNQLLAEAPNAKALAGVAEQLDPRVAAGAGTTLNLLSAIKITVEHGD